MRVLEKNGNTYRVPDVLNDFQERMYIHLIDWKWRHITRDPGYFQNRAYDAIIPDTFMRHFPAIYPDALEALKNHRRVNPFRFHRHFGHIVSSQAAAVNLTLPLMTSPRANDVLRMLKPDFKTLAADRLDHGFQLEYWGDKRGKGPLGDHSIRYGTDADIAIAYHDKEGELCLWLIEHKLTETGFTPCQAALSEGRQPHHDCGRTFAEILDNRSLCYYHDVRGFKYWDITAAHREFFVNHREYSTCPFQRGMNQLWRNQLLGLKLEDDKRFHRVYFSVVKHPENTALDKTISAYRDLVGDSEKFSVFTLGDVAQAAAAIDDPGLSKWAAWYRDMYMLG